MKIFAERYNDLRASFFGTHPDVLRVKTDDGCNLALRHYRPDPEAPFNDGKQPVLMMPGAFCTFNYFDLHTPEGEKPWSVLPEKLPGWAENDERIRKDPMMLYNMAYYLYSRGYDVWLMNYRGQGRGPFRSCGTIRSDLDHYGMYDIKAMIMKIREVTGKRPVHLGHSMGGCSALMYFQGNRHVPGSKFKVESDPLLVEERNAGDGPQAARGFVNLDGPRSPFVLANRRIPLITRLIWMVTTTPMYYDIRLFSPIMPRSTGKIANLFFKGLWNIRKYFPGFLDDLVAFMFFANPYNLDPGVFTCMAKYGADGGSGHMVSQFIDSCLIGGLRQCYRDGNWGKRKMYPPPDKSDGLYYYSDHFDKMSLPTICLADGTVDITKPGETEVVHEQKTRHPLDEFHVMPDTAHLCITCGLRAPFETFPTIGAWLEKLGSD